MDIYLYKGELGLMKKTLIIIFGVFLVIVISYSSIDFFTKDDAVIISMKNQNTFQKEYFDNIISKYEVKFEDMNNLPEGVFNIDKVLPMENLTNRGVKLRFKRILPFSEAIELTGGDPKDYKFVSGDTKVWVVQGIVPTLEHQKFGHMENVLVTNYYDTSSGELFGSIYKELD